MRQGRIETLDIQHAIDVQSARQALRALAAHMGFTGREQEEMALVVSELGTNLLKHATRGMLLLVPVFNDGLAGLQIESVDRGPGIADVDAVMADGFSTSGSLGHGMGTVNRMMDQLDIESERLPVKCHGTHIVCRRWIRQPSHAPAAGTLELGAATRPHPRMTVNGDAFLTGQCATGALVGVIDGVGHGEPAHEASQRARQYTHSHRDQPVEEIFRGVHRACRGTRGVVMALARFDWTRSEMTFGSVGNIEARVIGGSDRISLPIRRGILGGAAPSPLVVVHQWSSERTMVLHSDGLTSHWRWDDFPQFGRQSAPRIAQGLLRLFAKDTDDATVVVVRGVRRD